MQTGDTLHCWVPAESYLPHKQIFYLEKDASGYSKVIVPTLNGWEIIPFSSLPKEGFRRLDNKNLISQEIDSKGNTIFVKVLFWCSKDKFEIIAEIKDGVWTLTVPIEKPSWINVSNDKKKYSAVIDFKSGD